MKKTPFEIVQEQMDVIQKGFFPLKRTMKKQKTFEDFLQEKHAEEYHGTDDSMTDAYEHWCSELDVQQVCDFAQAWGDTLV